ncbi:DEAD/DEAH box helicase family protein [Fictibacillus nanhaiensis]|uniref:DEAD/DEAH box helicase family protein n=1 Tax=Fictibacillus nanhaiensis TaxID=742169 RepID=UPI002E1A2D2C|nr:DEAD/DEAH box helicase family protein [Fictibacillus nanhaiensis]MED1863800.1 DEAD/DEAH box helicase family protein [Fictibacillus nanhaiensis]
MKSIKLVTNNLYEELLEGLQSARSIHILTSFVMKSGVDVLAPHLKASVERGAEIQVCTGDYLFVTQPEALERLITIHPNISVRLFKSNGKSFHPKAYLFDIPDEHGYFIVGSSNLSRSALKTGTEWSLSLAEGVSPETYLEALDQFQKTFLHDQTMPVNKETLEEYQLQYESYHQKHLYLVRTWTKAEEQEMTLPKVEPIQEPQTIADPAAPYIITPRPSQQEALELLQNTFEEGYDKAMVVMATGLGKTYLAGLFAQNFKRTLFIAHREEILKQAKQSFQHIMPDKTYGLYYGSEKQTEADVIFASIYTLGMKRHLEVFFPDDFDLIVVDEFHHAAAQSYQRVIDYFKPKFLLGITATPNRMDGKDVYAICDGNVAYQIHFIEAIQKQWLAPFRYFGVYDDTDYRQITWLGTKYDEEELLAVQLTEEMLEKVYVSWVDHKQTRTISFCSSIRQANTLANYFKTKGVRAVSLNSKTVDISRGDAIQQLNDGQLDIIFTVDLFNEGVDIPSVDTLLFVRPTESLTVFTQQVGRGLRLHNDKSHCVIIDLIGNYRNADVKMQLFNTELIKGKGPVNIIPSVPEGCLIDFDIQVIDLLKELQAKNQPRKEKLLNAYHEIKRELGRRPTYLELHLQGKAPSQEYKQEFKSYVGFLYWTDELTEHEKEAFKETEDWLIEVEKTGMAKSYKMVVLKYMLSRGVDHWLDPVTPEELAPFFHRYLTEKKYRRRIDFFDKAAKQMWEYDEKKIARLIATMPMSKWSGSSKGKVMFNENLFRFNVKFNESINKLVFKWTKEICEFRLHYHFERKDER